MVTISSALYTYKDLELNHAMLYSSLLVAVILGSMRTTRRATLQLLSFSAGELWGKMWLYSPHRYIWATMRKALPPGVSRILRSTIKTTSKMVIGRSALRKTFGHKLVLKKSLRMHRGRRLNSTISLYRRMPLKTMSRLWGRFNQLELPVFLRKPLLGLYIWMFGCNLQEAEIEDLKLYRNLGEFFRRQLKSHVRPIDVEHDLTSPADGRILHYGQVKQGILEQVKGVTYSLRGFLGPLTWESPGSNLHSNHQSDEDYQSSLSLQPGNQLYHCIIYLAPGDYHRFHSPATWMVEHRRHFPGELLSVNPGVARWLQGLFNFNERAVYTGRWEHGFFSMTAVGATNVGSIKIYSDQELETNTRKKYPEHTYFDKKYSEPVTVQKGDMFGEFNLGSTIVLIFEAPSGFKFNVHEGDKVKYGRPLGTPLY
uniref:Phosphatidylserine decarboxylase proenzyme, mitochondrial n=1 Tax=Arion vulgaris TaxID=1028688 RepID=A0A0B6ZFD2_9EUPU